MAFILQSACFSHTGSRRGGNEDNFFFNGICMEEEHRSTHDPLLLEQVLRDDLCLAIFDGMGGENDGESASFAAAAALQKLEQTQKQFYQSGGKYLANLTQELNAAVFRKSCERMTDHMGTTMAMLYFTGSHVYACNVGDSRIYRLRESVFAQLSQDDWASGRGTEGKAPLTQYLGMDPEDVRIEPHIGKGHLRSGDIYLLCSDGLTDVVENIVISEILTKGKTPEDCAQLLRKAALDGGGKDDITAVVCRIRESETT